MNIHITLEPIIWLVLYGLAICVCISLLLWAETTHRPLLPYVTASGVLFAASTGLAVFLKSVRVL